MGHICLPSIQDKYPTPLPCSLSLFPLPLSPAFVPYPAFCPFGANKTKNPSMLRTWSWGVFFL